MQSRCLLSLAALCAFATPDLHAFQRPPARCDAYLAAAQADSNSVDAASSLGQCSFRDYEMIAPDGDSTRLMFRSSWSVALRALRRAVTLDPGHSRAYRPLFAILFAETRDGCSFVTGQCTHVSPVIRVGDSVITIPRLVRLNVPGVEPYEEVVRESQASRQANLSDARALAERWSIVAPNDRRPHEYLGKALLGLGDPAAAAIELERAATLGTPESRRAIFWVRFEALIKSDRGVDARRVLDEAVSDSGRDTTRLRGLAIPRLNALLGRNRLPPVDSARARRERARQDSMLRTHVHVPRPPAAPGFSDHLAAGDTVAARRLLARLDSILAPREGMRRFPAVGQEHLELATYHLALGDTASAEARLAEIERPFNDRNFQFGVGMMYGGPPPWLGHAWSLSGDLAAARGRPADAARMYRRVIGLWGGGDPELQPVVDRARARLNSLSPRQ